ncbi:hypothetical protein [Pseudomonas japonica]|uniref:hypothetical protein n=1 Tax=Pseudomonas japonica TaxID=256466 RepID=UPI0015E307F9|nr:hypothetical protein [Pseudomonas japonica]MBA1245461.1 hypothetical protein [Pseudomonas japonica]
MKAPLLNVMSLQLPAYLSDKCQALLEDIQRADSADAALLTEQRTVGFTEALEWLKLLQPTDLERLHELYERALTARIAVLGH